MDLVELQFDLFARYPGRDRQIELLLNLFGHPDEPLPECVYIHGTTSTGKSAITTSVLDTLQLKYAKVNLIECYSTRLLFESILNQLADHRIDPSTGEPFARCDTLKDFIDILAKFDAQRFVIVLDRAERLNDMPANLLPAFLRFAEIADLPITIVMISQLPFQTCAFRAGVKEPICIAFPQYNYNELSAILLKDLEGHPSGLAGEVFANFIQVFLSMFYAVCRDVSELRYIVRKNIDKYLAPVLAGTAKPEDSMALWRNISPALQKSLDMLYMRISIDDSSDGRQVGRTINLAQSLELPFYAKYLLIAAYLASYNPAKDDKRMFMKHHGKKLKNMRDVKSKSKVSELLNTQLGPKPFSLDRLLAIFYAILDDKVGFNNNLLVQVSSLVELQLLTALSDNFSLDGQKYKCAVSYDFILSVSNMVGFLVRKYMSDFSHN